MLPVVRALTTFVAASLIMAAPGHAATNVFAAFADSGEVVSGKTIVSVDVPPGRYAVLAKLNLDQDDDNYSPLLSVTCTLAPANVVDRNLIRLHPSATTGSKASDNASMPFQLITEFRTNTVIAL